MSMTKHAIESLIYEMSQSDLAQHNEFNFRDAQEARFDAASPSMLLWSWGHVEPGDHLKLSYFYHDADDGIVFVSVVFDRANNLKEIELWRGDGHQISRAPKLSELSSVELGKVHGP